MSGFVGICNFKRNLLNNKNIIQNMNMKLQKKKQEKEEYFIDKNINLGSRKLIISNSEETIQLMSIKYANIIYTIVCNGKLYNKQEIKKELQEYGYEFKRKFRHRSVIKSIYSFWNRYIAQIKWNI